MVLEAQPISRSVAESISIIFPSDLSLLFHGARRGGQATRRLFLFYFNRISALYLVLCTFFYFRIKLNMSYPIALAQSPSSLRCFAP